MTCEPLRVDDVIEVREGERWRRAVVDGVGDDEMVSACGAGCTYEFPLDSIGASWRRVLTPREIAAYGRGFEEGARAAAEDDATAPRLADGTPVSSLEVGAPLVDADGINAWFVAFNDGMLGHCQYGDLHWRPPHAFRLRAVQTAAPAPRPAEGAERERDEAQDDLAREIKLRCQFQNASERHALETAVARRELAEARELLREYRRVLTRELHVTDAKLDAYLARIDAETGEGT